MLGRQRLSYEGDTENRKILGCSPTLPKFPGNSVLSVIMFLILQFTLIYMTRPLPLHTLQQTSQLSEQLVTWVAVLSLYCPWLCKYSHQLAPKRFYQKVLTCSIQGVLPQFCNPPGWAGQMSGIRQSREPRLEPASFTSTFCTLGRGGLSNFLPQSTEGKGEREREI